MKRYEGSPKPHLFCDDRQHPSALPLSLAKIKGLWDVALGIQGLELNSRHEWGERGMGLVVSAHVVRDLIGDGEYTVECLEQREHGR